MACNLLFASDLNRFHCYYKIQKDTPKIFIHESRLLSVIRYLETKIVLRQRLWNGRKKRGQRERKMFYNARCVNKGL